MTFRKLIAKRLMKMLSCQIVFVSNRVMQDPLTLFKPGFFWLSTTGGGGFHPPPENNVTVELGQ